MTLISKLATFAVCSTITAMTALAQQDTEAVFVQVRDQAIECGRGINRSAEANACQKTCDKPTFDLRVLLGAVPQPIPSEIMEEVEACNAAYKTFKAAEVNIQTEAATSTVERNPASAVESNSTTILYPELTSEMTGFLEECEALTRKGRHQVTCVKFCTLAVSDIERLEGGDAELERQVSGFRGDAKRLPNMNQCRRFYGAATR